MITKSDQINLLLFYFNHLGQVCNSEIRVFNFMVSKMFLIDMLKVINKLH